MNNLSDYFRNLGGLHDARVLDLRWNYAGKCFSIEIDDLHSNEAGEQDYCGPSQAVIVCTGISKLLIEVDFGLDGLMIYDWVISQSSGHGYSCEVKFSPAGRVIFQCGSIEVVKE